MKLGIKPKQLTGLLQADHPSMKTNVTTRDSCDYQWVNVTMNAAFAPRDGAGALVFRGEMWLLGGWNPSDKENFPKICTNDVWRSRDGVEWTLVKPNTYGTKDFDPDRDWEGRHTAGYVVHDDRMWIVGGDPIQAHYQNDVWSSVDGKTWQRASLGGDVPWGPRVLHYTASFKGRIWVMGGQTLPQFAPEEERFYRDIWSSPDGARWTRMKPREPFWPQRGMIGGSAVFQDRIWILGGGTYDTPQIPKRKYFNDVWSSSDGVNWQRHLEHAPWAPRLYHDVIVFDDNLWVLEGADQKNRNDVWYSPDGTHWREVPDTPWKPRHAASLFNHDNALWVVAGNNMEHDVWKLTRKK